MYRYVLFDLDGTISDPKVGICTCVQYALKDFGIDEPDIDKLEPFIGPPLRDSFKEFYGFSDEDAEKATAKYRERFSTIGKFENEIYPGIPELLRDLKKKGKCIAIASSKPTVFVEDILSHFEIREYFDVVVGSELDGSRDTKEAVLDYTLRQMFPDGNIEYDEVVMIGDRKFDIEAAHKLGVGNIGVSYGYGSREELEEAGADKIVNTVTGLRTTLLPIMGQGATNGQMTNTVNQTQDNSSASKNMDWKAESKNAGKQSFLRMWGFLGPGLTYWVGGTAIYYIITMAMVMGLGIVPSTLVQFIIYSLAFVAAIYLVRKDIQRCFRPKKKEDGSPVEEIKLFPERVSGVGMLLFAGIVILTIGLSLFSIKYGLDLANVAAETAQEAESSVSETISDAVSKGAVPGWLQLLLSGLIVPASQMLVFIGVCYKRAKAYMNGYMSILLTAGMLAFTAQGSGNGLTLAIIAALACYASDMEKSAVWGIIVGTVAEFALAAVNVAYVSYSLNITYVLSTVFIVVGLIPVITVLTYNKNKDAE